MAEVATNRDLYCFIAELVEQRAEYRGECAAAGTFGGWQDCDDSGRSYVPGPVAVLDASGAISAMDPRDIGDPVVALPPITWDMFLDFLDAGQCYE